MGFKSTTDVIQCKDFEEPKARSLWANHHSEDNTGGGDQERTSRTLERDIRGHTTHVKITQGR